MPDPRKILDAECGPGIMKVFPNSGATFTYWLTETPLFPISKKESVGAEKPSA
jgi:hypothetical protein